LSENNIAGTPPKLASGELTAEAWQDFSVVAGIADLDLAGETILPQEASFDQRALSAVDR